MTRARRCLAFGDERMGLDLSQHNEAGYGI